MRVLDLFSGIGGFSLGLERAGMTTVAFCEIDPFCRRVLAKHWPEVPCYDDIRTLTAERLRADGIAVDVICGGFPCQDISNAGKRAGIEGERSGLWSEYARIIGELRPRFVIVENVAALVGRGLDRVLGDLAALRFDAEWHCIPASAVGAPHQRDRVWIVAYPARLQPRRQEPWAERERVGQCGQLGHSNGTGLAFSQADKDRQAIDAPAAVERAGNGLSDANGYALRQQQIDEFRECGPPILERNSWWESEPDVGRVAHGVPSRVDRLRSLGNAVVPQIPEIIGRAIMEAA